MNYQKELDRLLERLKSEERVPRLLLHSCCAPCSSYVLEYLNRYFEITVFYYNPNIYPESEYTKRIWEQQELISRMPFLRPVSFLAGPYDQERFYEMARGLEHVKEGGERCLKCYELRLSEAARMAVKTEADYFTTTLSISPLKNAEKLKMATVETAKASERGIVDIETLKTTNESLISTLDEVMNIQREGREKRQAAEAELRNMEAELKSKLLQIQG